MSDPNPQNIPIRTPEGDAVRRAFVDVDRWSNIDFARLELEMARRVTARAEGESPPPLPTFESCPGVKRGELYVLYVPPRPAGTSGPDDHVMRAAELFGVEPSAVTPEMRRRAKEWNFCKTYGGSAEKLANILKGVK